RQSNRRSPAGSKHDVTNMRSFQTMGDEWPTPGKGVFQAMFSVADQRMGNATFSWEMPSVCGRRHAGQGSPADTMTGMTSNPTSPSVFLIETSNVGGNEMEF